MFSVNEPTTALAGATGIAPGTEVGSQLFTKGRRLAGGGEGEGDGVISRVGEGLLVGVLTVVGVATGTLGVAGAGEGELVLAIGVAQLATASRMAMPYATKAVRRRS
jgi:hypothetical protein